MMKDYWDDLLECRDEVEKLREALRVKEAQVLAAVARHPDLVPVLADVAELAVPPPEQPQQWPGDGPDGIPLMSGLEDVPPPEEPQP